MATQAKPAHNFIQNLNNQETLNLEPKISPVKSVQASQNLIIDKEKEPDNIIDLNKDSKRKEIGFETESVLDSEWKEMRVDFKKLAQNYSKLSKKNLTGIFTLMVRKKM